MNCFGSLSFLFLNKNFSFPLKGFLQDVVVVYFDALSPWKCFLLTRIKVPWTLCTLCVLKEHLQATQNQPQHRFHWHGEPVLLCSVMVFKWVCKNMAEIQVYALTRRHTDCFGWRNGCGWLVQWVRACIQMLLMAKYGTSKDPQSQLSCTVLGCKDLLSHCMILFD